ncbi:aldo/keto reductase [Rudaeicoccus suwonensis]|uniref:Aryl-alcohol dehydrogenase-like predicted oxidoreductase n=1 Tax=Rudaeicoccus suwonensis TaxID=657409 RepID=A0A561DVN8_9MICO|nr:aldo/keto reductase [Rudaeicoccus suwonensis]TWE07422.1 aryl-alcohol dehydrogenase-like predicted oxidoreductase [Rudaeicoccus suwonensis]
MVPRRLGNTGIQVSPIGLGTVKLGRKTGVKYPARYELPTDDEVQALLSHALGLGVTLFDTAPAYGSSERRIAAFVKDHRDELVLSTKCGEVFEGTTSSWDFSRAALERQIAKSLSRMQTDHVDVLLLHAGGVDEDSLLRDTDAIPTLLDARERGQARSIGISAKTRAGVLGVIESLDVVMAPLNVSDQSLVPALKTAHTAGLAVLAIKVLRQGHTSDPSADLRWVTSQPFVDSVIVGTLSASHLSDAVRLVSC